MFLLSGCLSDFQELNTDTEQLGKTDPRNVFTGATLNFNNCSRDYLTGKYSGVMTYMQYLVPTGGANASGYVSPAKPNSHPQPNMPQYSYYYSANGDGFGAFGLRLNYLINTVIPNADGAERYANVAAISQILLSYEQWQILDVYGAAPITEGLKGQSDGIITPRYDLFQKDVNGTPMYKNIDADVKKAVGTLKASTDQQYALGTNDYFYKGDVAKWIKFGNTLRVKMAQRVEKADAAFYNSVVSEVLTTADNVIASNAESCIYHHPNDYNNNTDDIQGITNNYAASAAFVNFLKAYNDPRLPIMVRRNGFGDGNNNASNDTWFDTFAKAYPNWQNIYPGAIDRYVGMSANPDSAQTLLNKNAYLNLKYTKDDGTESTLDIRYSSQIESRYYVKNGGINGNNNMPLRDIEDVDFMINQDKIDVFTPIITYPETCFMLAEIAIKKNASVAGKDATGWYREGIKASMEQYQQWATDMFVVAQVNNQSANYNPVTSSKIAAYLARPEFQTATLEKIISQQWVNLYMQPEEMWATWKRTGLPKFKIKPVPENGVAFLESITSTNNALVIPRRNSLPVPNSLNINNYNETVKSLKQDAKYGADVQNTEGRIWWDMP